MDNLIENLQKQIAEINTLGTTRMNYFNFTRSKKTLVDIANFEKGFEVGSSYYSEEAEPQYIPYLRVGDLLQQSETYVPKIMCLSIATESDILIAFDGAPGRIGVGLSGAFSSGLYKVRTADKMTGMVYFELISTMCQKTISDYSQGTTILHASKAIPNLEYAECTDIEKKMFNFLYFKMINLKKQVIHLDKIKKLLLGRYFTNQ